MGVPYDSFAGAFLAKITEFELNDLTREGHFHTAQDIVDGYMKRAISAFKKVCKYDLTTTANDTERTFDVEIGADALDEIIDIVSEGMVVQWLKPYVYKQELLENVLNTICVRL